MTLAVHADPALKYRSDIDGLRAIAVLSVVIYHLGMPLHGGYVGVDIFFTISGFLIGSIILRETAERTFSYARFYERRIRRIFPALFAMLIVTSALAYRYLMPLELVDYAKTLAAACLSVSNIEFWHQSNYFAALASTAPLLHTWSLAIEEQFYMAMPPLLVLVHRYRPARLDAVIYLVCAVSLGLSIWSVPRYPSATFYFLHTRAWELLLGTMLALGSCPKPTRRVSRELAAWVGLALIGFAVVMYRDTTPFPGLAAVAPCLGTALVIAAGEAGRTSVSRLLSLSPIRFIGLISYSLYLWHWPLIVYNDAGFTLIEGLDRHGSQALLLAASIALGVLSYYLVETPFRNRRQQINRRRLFAGAAVATTAIVALAAGAIAAGGIPSRFSPDAQQVANYINNDPKDPRDQYRNGTCFITEGTATLKDYATPICLPDEAGKPKMLVLGDSHAAALWWGLHEAFPSVNVMQATASGCKPVLTQRPRQHPTCAAIMSYALRDYLPSHKVDAVVVAARWNEGDIDSVAETLDWLSAHHIPTILLGPIVQYDASLPRLLALSITHQDPELPGRHRARYIEPLDARMNELARDHWHVPYVSMFDLFCNGGRCVEYGSSQVPLQSDYGHLTKVGSTLAACRIANLGVLPDALRPSPGCTQSLANVPKT